MGRGGAGNVATDHATQQAERDSLEREKEIIRLYREKQPTSRSTGRGGAGAKGYVNPKGKGKEVAEEDIVVHRVERQDEDHLTKTGRGGIGNFFKGKKHASVNFEQGLSLDWQEVPRSSSVPAGMGWDYFSRPALPLIHS
jgi:hypothetical protein